MHKDKERTQAEGRYAEGMHAESITTQILTRPGRLRARSGPKLPSARFRSGPSEGGAANEDLHAA